MRGRGGFCYELNGLLLELLAALGYSVRRISARVYGAEGNLRPPYDHLALVVDCEGQWLVDVGFGDAFVAPLSLTTAEPARQRDREYRTTLDHGHLDYASKTPDGAWAPQYRFTLEARRWAEFEPRCAFHQTSPDSHFTQKRVVTRLTEAGRAVIAGEADHVALNGIDRWLAGTRLKGRDVWRYERRQATLLPPETGFQSHG